MELFSQSEAFLVVEAKFLIVVCVSKSGDWEGEGSNRIWIAKTPAGVNYHPDAKHAGSLSNPHPRFTAQSNHC